VCCRCSTACDLVLLVVVAAASSRLLSVELAAVPLSSLVPRPLWDRSNAADSGTNVIATVLGPAWRASPSRLSVPRGAPPPAIVMLLAALLLIGFVVPDAFPATTVPVLTDARAAMSYVWRNRILRMLAGTMTVFNACSGS